MSDEYEHQTEWNIKQPLKKNMTARYSIIMLALCVAILILQITIPASPHRIIISETGPPLTEVDKTSIETFNMCSNCKHRLMIIYDSINQKNQPKK